MVSSAELIRLQQQQNDLQQAKHEADKLQNLTLRRYWQDIANAVDGCVHDILVEPSVSLQGAFASPPRLRGFGFLLIAVALAGLLSSLVLGLRTPTFYDMRPR